MKVNKGVSFLSTFLMQIEKYFYFLLSFFVNYRLTYHRASKSVVSCESLEFDRCAVDETTHKFVLHSVTSVSAPV